MFQILKNLPLHPMLVHFPIALLVMALGCQLISVLFKRELWQQVAVRIYLFAVISTPLAVLTGLQEQWEDHLNHPVVNLHRFFAFSTLYTALISLPLLWFFYKKQTKIFKFVFLTVLLILVGLVSLTAYNGGRLVYEYGIGMEK